MYQSYRQEQHQTWNPSHGAPRLQSDEAAAMAFLQHLDKEDLSRLLNEDSNLAEVVKDLAQVKAFQTDREMLVTSNKSLSEYNLSVQPRFEDLKRKVATNYEESNQLKLRLGEDKAKLEMFTGDQTLDKILAILQAEAAKSDDESEQLADAFCDKNIPVDVFINEYLNKRKVAHLRRLKVEKMTELLQQHGQSQSAAPSSGYNNWSGNSQMSTNAPYPVGNSYMPDPATYRPR